MSARGHPADRRGDGLVHRGRRLRPGDERRDGDRPRPGHDLPRRPAAGEGGDRRGGDRRGARRRRRCTRAPPASSTTSPTTTTTRCGSCARIVATLPADAGRAPWERRRRRGARGRPRHALRRRAARQPHALRPARGDRPHRRRQPLPRVQGRRTATTLVCGFAHIHGHPVGILANHGILFSESALKARALHRAVRPARRPAAVPAEHHRLHGRAATTRRAASPRTAPRWSPPSRRARVPKLTVIVGGSFGAGNYGMCGRAYSPRFLWMWPNARISRHGRRAGGDGDGPRSASPRSARSCASSTSARATRTTPPRGSGTTA